MKNNQIHRDRSQIRGYHEWGDGGNGSYCLMVQFLFGAMKVWEAEGGDGCTPLRMYLN